MELHLSRNLRPASDKWDFIKLKFFCTAKKVVRYVYKAGWGGGASCPVTKVNLCSHSETKATSGCGQERGIIHCSDCYLWQSLGKSVWRLLKKLKQIAI